MASTPATTAFRDARILRAAREVLGKYTLVPMPTAEVGISRFAVRGGSEPYEVTVDPNWIALPSCTCPDAERRGDSWCKHVIGVMLQEPALRCQLLDLFLG